MEAIARFTSTTEVRYPSGYAFPNHPPKENFMGVVKFRPFKFERVATSAFLTSRQEQHERFMSDDLAKSGLEQEDLNAYVHGFLQLPEGATAGYVIPYYAPDEGYAVNEQNYLKI